MTVGGGRVRDDAIVWHDLECGGYAADLPLWRELAACAGGPVLDLGAGTGRVALDLAARGPEVIALDRDPRLLAALRERRGELPVEAVEADVRDFELDRSVALALAPMQTLQLLGGRDGRARCLAAVRRHLRPGGLLAAALADPLEGFDGESGPLPLPDMGEHDGWVYSSQPVAVRREGAATVIERLRQRVAPDGARHEAADVVHLDAVGARELEAEAAGLGYRALPRRRVAATEEHVGSTIVVLQAV